MMVAANPLSRRVDLPEPGFFARKLVKNGPRVGCAIFYDDGMWRAEINGKPVGAVHADPVHADGVFDIWHSGEFIDEDEYTFLVTKARWAEENAPEHPMANPFKPINLRLLPPLGTVASLVAPPPDRGNAPEAPAPLSAAQVTAWLEHEYAHVQTRGDALCARVGEWLLQNTEIATEEQQGAAIDLIKQVQDHIKLLKEKFEESKKPFRENGKAVDKFFNAEKEELTVAIGGIQELSTKFAIAKAAREKKVRDDAAAAAIALAAQAEKKVETGHLRIETAIAISTQAEVLQKDAAAPLAKLSQSRGDHNSVGSLRTSWKFEVTNAEEIPRQYWKIDEAAIQAVVNASKDETKIPGIKVYPEHQIGVK